jgi:hypothetical protein
MKSQIPNPKNQSPTQDDGVLRRLAGLGFWIWDLGFGI